jgi:hypothetical protein
MKKIVLAAAVIAASLVPSFAQAEWSGYYKVEQVMATTDGVRVKLKGFENKAQGINCANKSEFFFSAEEPTMMAKVELLIAAKVNDFNVNVSYYECSKNGYLKLASALLV